jgi:hypothetical protein
MPLPAYPLVLLWLGVTGLGVSIVALIFGRLPVAVTTAGDIAAITTALRAAWWLGEVNLAVACIASLSTTALIWAYVRYLKRRPQPLLLHILWLSTWAAMCATLGCGSWADYFSWGHLPAKIALIAANVS